MSEELKAQPEAATESADSASEPGMAGKMKSALSGTAVTTWGALSKSWAGAFGAANGVWGALSGALGKVKTTSVKASVAVTSWWKRRSNRSKIWLVAGGALAIIAAGVAVFLVLFLRPVFVVEAMSTEDAIVCGDDVVLSVDVTNKGRTGGEYELRALVDGREAATESVDLDAGARRQVTITLSGLSADHYDIALAGWLDLAHNVWVMTPADIRMGEVRVEPNPMDINTSDEAKVLVELTNAGEAPGSYELEVSLNGEVLEARRVQVDGAADAKESFAMSVTGPGSCQVAVNGDCVDVEIYQIERPKNGEILAREAGGSYNQLKVYNNGDLDCVIALVRKGGGQSAALTAYVHAQSACTVLKVPDGTYACYYSSGEDWCTYRRAFTADQAYGKFDETMTFKVTRGKPYLVGMGEYGFGEFAHDVTYTVITLDLGGTSEEQSPSTEVSPDEFPRL